MKIVDSLVNRSEEVVLRELQQIASDNAVRVFVKQRLSDVIQKGGTHLTNREFDFYTRSHCDFVVTDADARPLVVVEYDGPLHQLSAEQQERDEIKNELCRRAELGLLRINDNYVTKLYRGMSTRQVQLACSQAFRRVLLDRCRIEAKNRSDLRRA
jgi:very-short-patch-repair endonuclease